MIHYTMGADGSVLAGGPRGQARKRYRLSQTFTGTEKEREDATLPRGRSTRSIRPIHTAHTYGPYKHIYIYMYTFVLAIPPIIEGVWH